MGGEEPRPQSREDIVSCSPPPWSRPVPDPHPVCKHHGVNKALCLPCQPGFYKYLFWTIPQSTSDFWTEYLLTPWLPGKSLSLSCKKFLRLSTATTMPVSSRLESQHGQKTNQPTKKKKKIPTLLVSNFQSFLF